MHTKQAPIECAAGKHCTAPSNANLANSTHNCWGCRKKIHSALLCEYSLSDLLNKHPSLVSIKLSNGWIIEQDGDNQTCSVCFTFISPLSIFINSCSTTVKDAVDANEANNPDKSSAAAVAVNVPHTTI